MSVRRDSNLLKTHPTSGYLQPSTSYTVKILPVGAVSSAASTYSAGTGKTTIPVFTGHGFTAGQKLMVGLTPASFAEVDSVTTTTVLFVGNSFSVAAAYTLIVNMGNDSGTTSPQYNGTTVLSYLDPALINQTVTAALVTADANSNYGYWHDGAQKWELVRNVAGTPQAIYPDIVSPELTTTGTPVVDNEIVRFNGTDGLSIQGTANANRPIVSDAGVITAPAANILGTAGNTTAILGAATVAQTLDVTGNVTVGSASAGLIKPHTHNISDLGLTGTRFKDLYLAGNATITGGVTAATLTTTGAGSVTGDLSVGRIRASNGASLVAGNFSLTTGGATGWSTSTITGVTGEETAFTITIQAGGTPSSDPVFVLNYLTTFTTAPIPIVVLSSGTGVTVSHQALWTTTATVLTVTLKGAALTAGQTVTFTGHIIGT